MTKIKINDDWEYEQKRINKRKSNLNSDVEEALEDSEKETILEEENQEEDYLEQEQRNKSKKSLEINNMILEELKSLKKTISQIQNTKKEAKEEKLIQQTPQFQPIQQPIYNQPQQPIYNQPQQPIYNQPQQPIYNQPQPNIQPFIEKPKKKFKYFKFLMFSFIFLFSGITAWLIVSNLFEADTITEVAFGLGGGGIVTFVLFIIYVFISRKSNNVSFPQSNIYPELNDINSCPICKGKIAKSNVYHDGYNYKQSVKCLNPSCDFRKELSVNI